MIIDPTIITKEYGINYLGIWNGWRNEESTVFCIILIGTFQF